MSQARDTKNRLFDQFARLAAALASPKRLELLDLLCQSEKTVETLARQASLTAANASRHLQILRGAQLVDVRKEGVHAVYRLADQEVCEFYRSMRRLAVSRFAEIDRIAADYFDRSVELIAIDRDELLERAASGEVIVLDVRPHDEYRAGHLPHARSIPLAELKDHLAEFAPEQEIVAYCRGPYCVLAQEAVSLMRTRGLRASRLPDGVGEFREAGYTLESNS